MGKAPAFQLYASDFDMDTASWDNDEVGIYFRLLMYQWVNGSIPSDIKRLSKITRISPKKFQNRWKIISRKFQDNGNNELVNPRMELVREEQDNYRKLQSEAGKRGVEKKREKGIYPFNKPSSDPSSDPSSEKEALQSSSSSSPLKKVSSKEDTLCPHLKIIEIYHQKLPMLPVVQNYSEYLKKRLRSRWREDPQRQNLEWWGWYFDGILECDFLIGKVKDWAASFYWLTGPKNMTKVLNGEYVNRNKNVELLKDWRPPDE